MLGNKKSKLLQTLEQSVPPTDQEDAIRLIVAEIRKPWIDPIEQNTHDVDSQKEHLRVLHMDHAIKFQETMEHFNVSPTAEDLDQVMPVKDQALEDMLDILTDIAGEEEYDEEDEEGDQYDGDDEGEDEDEEEEEESPNDKDNKKTEFNLNNIL
ncbi:histone chaperone ASF1 [Drosophila obscura]|uniref:histone chaperone ASF1 n=1 Tax=Drosophila obscura TaxID=7282 RepID=UPI001BB0F60A|nr:histone chaperone ASF1 [Drosophila obscura]